MAVPRQTRNPCPSALAAACVIVAAVGCSDATAESPSGAAGRAGAGGSGGDSAGPSGGSGAAGGDGAGGVVSGSGGSAGATAGSSAQAGSTAGGSGGSGGVSAAGADPGGAASTGGGGSPGGEFAPCPPSGACKILPLGDSITDGLSVAGGYRVHLFELASEDDKTITFVGGSMNGPQMVAGKAFPRSHEGHSGWTISQLDGIVPSPALGVEPHIVLLHIGTNDMYQGAANADERLGTLIDQILQTLPNALLLVSNIIPFPGSANAVTTYNAAVPGVVDTRAKAGKHVVFVDQFEGFPTSELADGVHPNDAGYDRMARTWYAAIAKYLR